MELINTCEYTAVRFFHVRFSAEASNFLDFGDSITFTSWLGVKECHNIEPHRSNGELERGIIIFTPLHKLLVGTLSLLRQTLQMRPIGLFLRPCK